ncbi:hypothetical protein EVAR_93940_1 [Eumeta japonica]|uniref:Uncharacterized protein n=1 Tax=Eumeta variegata TaxID=151549 RepID=A0A4C1TP63_EUMVA|nr:hypothetical protein EVAR_93940_1 [Eumeta japonica]
MVTFVSWHQSPIKLNSFMIKRPQCLSNVAPSKQSPESKAEPWKNRKWDKLASRAGPGSGFRACRSMYETKCHRDISAVKRIPHSVQRTNLCRCEVSYESVAVALNKNAGQKREESGSAELAYCRYNTLRMILQIIQSGTVSTGRRKIRTDVSERDENLRWQGHGASADAVIPLKAVNPQNTPRGGR